MFDDLSWNTLHQDFALMDDERPVDEFEGFPHIVIRNKHPDSPRRELSHQLAYIADRNWINPCEWFVEQEEFWTSRERPGDFNAPAFSAR
jgi:hypothetical protein